MNREIEGFLAGQERTRRMMMQRKSDLGTGTAAG